MPTGPIARLSRLNAAQITPQWKPRLSAFLISPTIQIGPQKQHSTYITACTAARRSLRGAAWSPLHSPLELLPLPPALPSIPRSVACASADAGAVAAPQLPFWVSYISRKPLLLQALLDCLSHIRQQGPLPDVIDVAMVYVSSEYSENYELLIDQLRQELPGLRNVFGCTGFGIIGVDENGAREVEAQPALSLTLATIPQAEVVVRHLYEKDLPDGDAPPDRWSAVLGVPAFPEAGMSVVVLSDPSFSAVQDLLAGLDFAFPTATKIGGLSSSSSFGGSRTAMFCWSASTAKGEAALSPPTTFPSLPAASSSESFPAATASTASTASSDGGCGGAPITPALNSEVETANAGSSITSSGTSSSTSSEGGNGSTAVFMRGASVMSIHGEVQMDLMIAQGCRPLTSTIWTVDKMAPGKPSHVAALSSDKVARGKSLPALEAFQIELQSVLSGMTEVQLRRTVANLTVGVAPEGLKASLEPQDFLIRALRGFDSDQCLVVGEYMRVGQRVRFMVRDKQGAQEDLASHGLSYKRKQLQAMLQGDAGQRSPPFGMLMFTCNGRGSGLYGEDSYDARTMSSYVPVPCAGFQCNGEIGRVGNSTHLHGFTCAVGVMRLTPVTDLTPPPSAVTASTPASLPSPPPAPSEQQHPEQQ